MNEFYDRISELKYLGIEHADNTFQPPFILEHSIKTGYYKYIIVDEEEIYFFQVLWDRLDEDNLYSRRIIFHRDETIYCRDDIIIYFKKEKGVFFVTSKNIHCLIGEYHVKGVDKSHSSGAIHNRNHENKKRVRRKYLFEEEKVEYDEEMCFFRFSDEEKVFAIPTAVCLKIPFLQHVIFQDFMQREKKKKQEIQLEPKSQEMGKLTFEIPSSRKSSRKSERNVIVLLKSDHFSERSIQLAIKLVKGKKNLSHLFFEDFSSKNISQKIFYDINGYRNCVIIMLSDQRVFFYYREGLRKMKILKIMEYDIVGGVEITSKIGNILFFHEKCQLFLNTKYRKHISVKELQTSRFQTKNFE